MIKISHIVTKKEWKNKLKHIPTMKWYTAVEINKLYMQSQRLILGT